MGNFNYRQIRFFSEGNLNNSPSEITVQSLSSSFFENYKIVRLGIQTSPGVKFYVNDGKTPVEVGFSGIFEIDLQNTGLYLNNLKFDEESLYQISQNKQAHLILNIIYIDIESINPDIEYYTITWFDGETEEPLQQWRGALPYIFTVPDIFSYFDYWTSTNIPEDEQITFPYLMTKSSQINFYGWFMSVEPDEPDPEIEYELNLYDGDLYLDYLEELLDDIEPDITWNIYLPTSLEDPQAGYDYYTFLPNRNASEIEFPFEIISDRFLNLYGWMNYDDPDPGPDDPDPGPDDPDPGPDEPDPGPDEPDDSETIRGAFLGYNWDDLNLALTIIENSAQGEYVDYNYSLNSGILEISESN